MNTTVSAIVLTRDLDGLLAVCLRHLGIAADRAGAALDLTVVDNASAWPVPDRFEDAPAFRRIRFDRHHGFAEANNLAVAEAAGDILLFLNNDVLLAPGTLRSMLGAFAAHPALAICGTRMVFPDRTIQHAGVVFGPGGQGPYHLERGTPSHLVPRTRETFQAVTGACLMIPRTIFSDLGGFDAGYDFGLEDVDLCLRARQAGGEIRCRQDTESLHFESMTPGRIELDRPSRAHFMSVWKGRYAIDG